ncbi:PilW family protein [Hyalangium rubrum]|uniref:Prepilin-type N-terminal cleavage/methylation domain-containing protein n=1 Tax=Hyalangium rubrum TaxID=3103134 RepID=A0ABU5H2W1_9BACT|nr:prepilin-type N-terminal cleavage/methylation domain-containing protein [Hyalangium sp. s54d21]MDY7227651.1 prepilin-type N-terminal cleavage/methylation domain-containing protein [Hyalangium sp. s54d21]
MRPPLRSRGFTLVELLIGGAVGAVVLLGISLTFISQARQYQAHASRRAIQANARQALAFMGRAVRTAGYGVNPDRAVLAYDSYDVESDSAVPGYPDAVVIHWRDTLFRRNVASANSNQIIVQQLPVDPADPGAERGLREPLRRGQILLVLCPLARQHAFVTVRDFVPVGETTIPLDQTMPASAVNTPIGAPGRLFHEQASLDSEACFSAPGTQVVKVRRAAFYVAMFDADGLGSTPERTPYLMMHQGLDMPTDTQPQGDNVIDVNDSVPVAEGIEQLQVAYILNSNNDTAPLVRGVTDDPMLSPNYYGEQWERIDPSLLTNWFFDPSVRFTDARRMADHPANIRQVRLTVVSRSTVADPDIRGDNLLTATEGAPLANGTIPWRQLENLGTPAIEDFNPSGRRFYRVLLRESITPKNMMMNSQFPPVSFTANTLGGG